MTKPLPPEEKARRLAARGGLQHLGHGVTKYGPERVKRILDAIAMGATRGLACKYAGIDDHTIKAWEDRFPDFRASVLEAEGRAAVGWLAKIEKAANDGTWTAAAWKLERLYPESYGRTVQDTRHQGPDGTGPVKVEHDHGAPIARALDTLAALVAQDEADGIPRAPGAG